MIHSLRTSLSWSHCSDYAHGTRTYLHAVLDNFSRRILAWKLAPRLEPQTTCQILSEAAKNLPKDGGGATVVADSGVENINQESTTFLVLDNCAAYSPKSRSASPIP